MGKQMSVGAQAVAERRKQLRDQLAGLAGSGGGNMIRLDNRTFKLPPDGNVAIPNDLDVVILGFGYRNQYYTTGYNANERSFPACFAVALAPAQLAPSDNSPDKQADKCAMCWANKFESGQGNAKACQNRVQLAVQIYEHGPDSDIYIISVSPGGLKNWRVYADALAQRGAAPIDVVTRVSFDTNVTYPKLKFGGVQKLDDDELEQFAARLGEADEALLYEPTPPVSDNE